MLSVSVWPGEAGWASLWPGEAGGASLWPGETGWFSCWLREQDIETEAALMSSLLL